MQYMNSSPSMTMLLQPDFSRPPVNPPVRGWQPVSVKHQPRPPPQASLATHNPYLKRKFLQKCLVVSSKMFHELFNYVYKI